ncbi:hypothetical protein [Flavihumibacter petaseus]|uniref:Uncharacterized protein n=1 Tax=Flavihumibacter petaseus NBRC 106054 TaxID=1220578 RepID=A0A0E9N277_9BACT|nr:hypothetical protein [Flavihumibacter petaseus]GAO43771.1 hypothetical protein FPE01S_02_08770 [Flavihumibacter petaseus NBRC 106054]
MEPNNKSSMTEADIQRKLRNLFADNSYHLYNQYIIKEGWESDYFSVTRAGLIVECEVKISRSDFFADFKKPKHRYYQALVAGKSHVVDDLGRWDYAGDIICSFQKGVLNMKGSNWGYRRGPIGRWTPVHEFYQADIRHEKVQLRAPCHSIRIRQFDEMHLPHRFMFAVPKGLIRMDEVPPYAGLIEVDEAETLVTRRGPVLHKRKNPPHLWKTILDKYYFKHSQLITNP